jgi:hypothetical protein
MSELFWSFSPWAAFLIATRFTSFTGAAIVGLLAALVVVGRAIARRRLHLLDVVATVYFIALAGMATMWPPSDTERWGVLAQAGSHLLLTVVVFASVAVGRPFTAAYARQSTPREYWHTATFEAVNRRVSTAWGLALAAGTVSLVLADQVDGRPALLRVVIPVGALVAAYRYTQTQISQTSAPAHVSTRHPVS